MPQKPAKKRRGRGEGGIDELPSGAFRASVSLGVDPVTKQRVRQRATFATKREALEWRQKALAEAKALAGGPLTARATTVGEWLTDWLAARKGTAAANTVRTEADTLERHLRPHLKDVRLGDLTPVAVERWLARLAADEVTPNECRKAAKLLKLVLNAAVERKLLAASPAANLPLPRHQPAESTFLDATQLAALLAAAAELGHGAMFRLWADTGLRPGELYGLQWGDVSGAAVAIHRAVCSTSNKLKTPKTKRGRRTLLIAPSTAAAVAEFRATCTSDQVSKHSPVWGTPRDNKHWTNQNFTKAVFDPVAQKAGLSAVSSPYTLRHTMATHLLRAGVSLKVVSHRLGHEDEVTTLRTYAHVLPGMQEAAAAAMEQILNPPAKVDDSPADGPAGGAAK